MIAIKPAHECRWDLVALGEVMLRFDPGERRIATTRLFTVCEGGAEYNVARGLRTCFGLRTGIVTALADNPVGRLVEGLIREGGVEPVELRWAPHDGLGRSVRNGLNFVERGFGVRPPVGCSDRGHTAVSQLQPGDIDWDRIFGRDGVRWLHCGGVFAGLSPTTPAVAAEAMAAARRHGTIVSYDLNYRPSLWPRERADAVNRELVAHADVLFGDDAPDVAVSAALVRRIHSAGRHDLSAVCRTRDGVHHGPELREVEVLDRIGSGDAFAAGLTYGLLSGAGLDTALAYGVAHAALTATTPGDTSMATLAEVERLAAGETAEMVR